MSEFSLRGMRVVSSPLATARTAVIERMPIPKKRRRWRLRYEQRPAAFVINPGAIGLSGGKQLAMHPSLIEQMRAAIATPTKENT